MERAIESVFAEYQKELLEEFGVFGLDGSYESESFSEDMVLERTDFYGGQGIDKQIRAIRLLTDGGGQYFREQAAHYMESRYGISTESELDTDVAAWEEQSDGIQELEAYAKEQELTLESLLAGTELKLPEENNPLANMKLLQSKPLLELVMPEGMRVSEANIDLTEFASHRERRQGYGAFSGSLEIKTLGTLAFGEYLLEHFYSASDVDKLEGSSLRYELEYIIGGAENDKENLDKVIKKLLLMRMVSNYSYIANDPEKKAEAKTVSFGLASLVLLPEITEAITQVLLLAWAFGESVVDLRGLLEGKKVPLIKTGDSWQLSLAGLSKLGTKEEQIQSRDDSRGLSYQEYLRILLFLQEKKEGEQTITMRSLDMIEKRLRYDKNLEWFRADHCISKLEIKCICNLRRGITYQFETYFGYR